MPRRKPTYEELESRVSELRENEQKLDHITSSLPGLVYQIRFDIRERPYFTYLSDYIRQLYELEPEDVLNDPFELFGCIHPDDREKMRVTYVEGYRSHSEISVEFRIITPGGTLKWLNDRAQPHRLENGEYEWNGFTVDITEKKHVELELASSESRLNEILQKVHMLGVILNRDGRVVYCNDYLLRVTGYTRDEVLGADWFETFIHSGIRDEVRTVFENTLLKGDFPPHYENEVLRSDGRPLLIFWSNTVFRDPEGEVIGVTSLGMDITDQRRAELALGEREARLHSIFRAAPIGIGVVIDRVFQEVNDSFCQMTGYTREELLGNRARMIYPSDHEYEKVGREKYGEIRKTGSGSVETRFKRKDGSVIEVILSSAPLDPDDLGAGVTFTAQDITERNMAIKSLRQSEQQFRNLAESMPETIFEIDLDGRLLYANQAAFKVFGYQPEDLEKGINVFDLIVPEDRENALANVGKRVGGTETGLNKYRMHRKDGSEFPALFKSTPVFREGRPAGLRGFLIDMTEREKLEQERMKAARLESIGLLAGGIAHDFNNILTSILGNISLAGITLDGDPAESLELIRDSERACLRARELTQQLLTFSKGGEPAKKTAVISRLVRTTADFSLRGSNTNVEYSFADDLWTAEIDEGQISQVVQNLVINADQAMPAGGVLEISAENTVHRPGDHLPLEPGNYILIKVRDRGTGISAEHLDKIFDPYFTTKQKGSGLGLATSYSVVKRHGGHITVESQLRKGTEFRIYLPASDREAESTQPAAAQRIPPGARVLVMDDEETVLQVAERLLEHLGCEVATAPDGEQALRLYGEALDAGRPFDAVILDLTVPGAMGGLEAAAGLRELDPGVRALVSSGYSNDPVLADPARYGFAGVVSKPYRAGDLAKALAQTLAASP